MILFIHNAFFLVIQSAILLVILSDSEGSEKRYCCIQVDVNVDVIRFFTSFRMTFLYF